jgi:hypothetical protein
MTMLQRKIFEVLDRGRTFINDDSRFLTKFLCDLGLSEEEAEGVRTYWDSKTFKRRRTFESVRGVDIIHQFPAGDQVGYPCWAIVLISENEESPRLLGDEGDDELVDGVLQTTSASFWRSRYDIFTIADSPDACIYYHEIARFFMMRARDFLKTEEGGSVLSSSFSSRDVMQDPRYNPERQFIRALSIDLTRCERVFASTQEARGNSIAGAFVQNPDGLDIIGVNPKVGVYE